jgi:CDP-glucose 4,6-dehydratase
MGINYSDILEFYRGKKVLVTGHTGFKGTWLTRILLDAGAVVTGYSLNPPTTPNLFDLSGVKENPNFTNVIGDIRDLDKMKEAFAQFKPEVVLHLAAQPIVRDSYKNPVYTYSTNVMGTVNVLECVRTTIDENGSPVVKSMLNVTTDKVYHNNEWEWGYRENEPLDGFDPYSNSKSCSELVTHSYKNSFFADGSVAISTARAGNVIGGGDFANDRIIPDSVRAMEKAKNTKSNEGVIGVRNPYSTRPYQHVLEPLFVYLTIAAKQYQAGDFAGYYNVGPDDCDCVTTGDLVDLFCSKWNKDTAGFPRARWENHAEANAPHEANFLKLDCSKIKSVFGWNPRWHIDECMDKTVEFSKAWLAGNDLAEEMSKEIKEFAE